MCERLADESVTVALRDLVCVSEHTQERAAGLGLLPMLQLVILPPIIFTVVPALER